MYENAQFAIKYCFLILRNGYSSKKCVDSEINLISLKNHGGMCSGNLRMVSEHLRDYFQPTVFNLHVATMTFNALFLCYYRPTSVMPVSLPTQVTAWLSVKMYRGTQR